MDRDWNLLFGILAVRLQKISPAQLVDAAARWIENPQRDMPDWLAEANAIQEDDRHAITRLVNDAVAANNGDASATLALFGGEDQIYECYRGTVVLSPSRGVRSATPPESSEFDVAAVPAVEESPGRYNHVSEYARGGMGRVLLVEDKHLGRKVAWKELLLPTADPSEPSTVRMSMSLVSRFLQEARITGQLEHPSIVPVYELGRRANGSLYYTMKLVRGENLQKAIRACESLADRLKLLPHFLDLCQALAYAHSRGVIHRDIKPANVMVGEFGETVVLDWGLATTKDDPPHTEEAAPFERVRSGDDDSWGTEYGSALGTPSYMPPEQAEGHLDHIDERSDVYSLGAVLYELLTGRAPFSDASPEHILNRVIHAEPKPVRELEPEVPPDLAAICERAMQKLPSRRYHSARELADEIARFQSGAFVRAYEYGFLTYLRKFIARHKAVVAVSTAAVAVIIGLSTYFAARIVSTNQELRAANEVAITGFLQSIADAQRQFQQAAYQDQNGDGEGDYGTLTQLSMADRSGILSRYVDAFEKGSHLGYSIHLDVTPGNGTRPPAFHCLALPIKGGLAGNDAFVVDESGIVRTATRVEQRTREIATLRSVKLLHYWGASLAAELNKFAAEFQRDQPSFRVEPVSLSLEAFTGNVSNTLQRSPSPDLLAYWPGAKTQHLVTHNLLLPIDDVWKDSGLVGRLQEDVRDASSYNQSEYLLPLVRNVFLFFYNRAIFGDANITPPATWQEFLRCSVLKERGITPTAIAAKDKFPYYFWFDYLLLQTAGRDYRHALAHGDAQFTDPEVERVCEILNQLFADGFVAPGAPTTDSFEALQQLVAGETATLLTGTWTGMQLQAHGWNPGVEFGVFSFPAMDGGASQEIVGNLDTIALSAKAAYLHGAKAFLKHLAQPESQLRLSKISGGLPMDAEANLDDLSELQRIVHACAARIPESLLALDLVIASPDVLSAFASRVDRLTTTPGNYKVILQELQAEIDDMVTPP